MPHKPQLWPVIHHRDVPTTLANAKLAEENGCVGVFLIHHQGRDHELNEPARLIKAELKLKIGINRLTTPPDESIRQNIAVEADATWANNCGVSSFGSSEVTERIQTALKNHPEHLFFVSVAFKYQVHELQPARAALNSYPAGFIPVTSGAKTGSAPSVSRILFMDAALPEVALGIASGITTKNVEDFLPATKYFLVATGISKDFHTFNPEKLRVLAEKIHSYREQEQDLGAFGLTPDETKHEIVKALIGKTEAEAKTICEQFGIPLTVIQVEDGKITHAHYG